MKKESKSKKSKNSDKKMTQIQLVFLVAGLLVGLFLMGLGIYKNINSDYNMMKLRTAEEVRPEVDAKREDLKKIRTERDAEYEASGNSAKYQELNSKFMHTESELLDLEAELFSVTSGEAEKMRKNTNATTTSYIIAGAVVCALTVATFGFVQSKTGKKENKILSMKED